MALEIQAWDRHKHVAGLNRSQGITVGTSNKSLKMPGRAKGRKSKDRQYNGEKKKDKSTNNNLKKHYKNTKH
jgi:hypothetical protein